MPLLLHPLFQNQTTLGPDAWARAQVHNFALPKSMEGELLQARAPDEGDNAEAAEQASRAPASLCAYTASNRAFNEAKCVWDADN